MLIGGDSPSAVRFDAGYCDEGPHSPGSVKTGTPMFRCTSGAGCLTEIRGTGTCDAVFSVFIDYILDIPADTIITIDYQKTTFADADVESTLVVRDATSGDVLVAAGEFMQPARFPSARFDGLTLAQDEPHCTNMGAEGSDARFQTSGGDACHVHPGTPGTCDLWERPYDVRVTESFRNGGLRRVSFILTKPEFTKPFTTEDGGL